MKEVKYDKAVILYLDELTDTLIEKEYFSFYDTSVEYIWDLISFVKNNINSLPHKKAPAYFSKYGKNCFTFLTTETKEPFGTFCLKKQTLIS